MVHRELIGIIRVSPFAIGSAVGLVHGDLDEMAELAGALGLVAAMWCCYAVNGNRIAP